jgi:hypothetical protein
MLFIEFVPNLSECLHGFAARDNRQLHPPTTSITSSKMLGRNWITMLHQALE